MTCIAKLAESQANDMAVIAIAGHVSRRMLEHYSRNRTEAKGVALDALSTPVFEPRVPQNVHQVAATDSDQTARLVN